jgi:hypothetical protein
VPSHADGWRILNVLNVIRTLRNDDLIVMNWQWWLISDRWRKRSFHLGLESCSKVLILRIACTTNRQDLLFAK